ncbi:MAG: hypothetical protein VB066_05835 [Paludibacter sp.]|nr:hypothetical protein [Paludibacter sp.]
MKTIRFKVAMLTGIAMLGIVSCTNSPSKKAEVLEDAKENVLEAEQGLDKAVNDSINEYARYKMEAEAKLVENDLKIAALKTNMKAERIEVRTNYEKQLNELEQKNAALKVSISEYQESDVNKWEKFKAIVNQDIEEIKLAITRMSENRK